MDEWGSIKNRYTVYRVRYKSMVKGIGFINRYKVQGPRSRDYASRIGLINIKHIETECTAISGMLGKIIKVRS